LGDEHERWVRTVFPPEKKKKKKKKTPTQQKKEQQHHPPGSKEQGVGGRSPPLTKREPHGGKRNYKGRTSQLRGSSVYLKKKFWGTMHARIQKEGVFEGLSEKLGHLALRNPATQGKWHGRWEGGVNRCRLLAGEPTRKTPGVIDVIRKGKIRGNREKTTLGRTKRSKRVTLLPGDGRKQMVEIHQSSSRANRSCHKGFFQ